MGTWGEGIFENDAALDAVEHVLETATNEIEAFCLSDRCGIEDIEAVMACVAVHLALHERCDASAPDLKVAIAMRKRVLAVYDEQIDSLDPDADYREARRRTLVETLDRYERAAQQSASAT